MKKLSIVIVAAILFVIFSTTSTTLVTNASSEGQRLAPGQSEICGDTSSCNHNPSGDFNPPGNQDSQDDMSHANSGQCQKFYSDPSVIEGGHDLAHDICFD
jgi:hypothetical protein